MDLKFKIGTTDQVNKEAKEPGSFLVDKEKGQILIDVDKTTRIGISGGVGEATPEGGENFTTYDEKEYTDLPYSTTVGTIDKNEIISEHATAFGSNNVSGCRAFKMTSCNENNKTYTFDIGDLAESEKTLLQTARYYATWLFTAAGGDNRAEMIDGVKNITISGTSATATVSYFQKMEVSTSVIDPTKSYIRFYDANFNPILLGTDSIEGWSFVTGINNKALGMNSFATGKNNVADGANSFVTGNGNKAGFVSFASGRRNKVKQYGGVFGEENTVTGYHGFASGRGNEVSGQFAHAEGTNNRARGEASHAEGANTYAEGQNAHSEGTGTHAEGLNTHSEGLFTHAKGQNSHAEGHGQDGYMVTAFGTGTHAEGIRTRAEGAGAHSEGADTHAIGNRAHSEGNMTYAKGFAAHAEGSGQGKITNLAKQTDYGAFGDFSHSEGNKTKAQGEASHAEGYLTESTGFVSHAEGEQTTASARGAHSEGYNTQAIKEGSHAEGYATKANGISSHAEGYGTIAQNDYSHAEGRYNNIYTNNIISSPEIEGYLFASDTASAVSINSNGYVQWSLNNSTGTNQYIFKAKKWIQPSQILRLTLRVTTLLSNFSTTISLWGWPSDSLIITADGKVQNDTTKFQIVGKTVENLSTGEQTIELLIPEDVKDYNYISLRFFNNSKIDATIELLSMDVIEKIVDENILHSIGNGTSEENRSNAFAVYQDGHAEVQLMGETPNSVVTREYVGEIENVLNEILAIQNSLIGE